MYSRPHRFHHKGGTLALMAVMLPVFVILAAITIDLTKICLVENQLQTAADAGALSGAASLRVTDSSLESLTFSLESSDTADVFQNVNEVVGNNNCAHLTPESSNNLSVTANNENLSDGEVVLGAYSGITFVPQLESADSVKVVVRLTDENQNGKLPLIFGGILTFADINLEATAAARIEQAKLLPFILFDPAWQELEAGIGDDLFNVTNGSVVSGPDGVLELGVTPGDWDGIDMPSGNFGWIDLGPDSGTDVLRRQIDEGPIPSEIDFYGGSLNAGDLVSGQTGFKAGTEVAFVGGDGGGQIYDGIIGKPRIVPLFDLAAGQGTNATFRITRFVMVRVVSANLGGNPKELRFQPVTDDDDPQKARLME